MQQGIVLGPKLFSIFYIGVFFIQPGGIVVSFADVTIIFPKIRLKRFQNCEDLILKKTRCLLTGIGEQTTKLTIDFV